MFCRKLFWNVVPLHLRSKSFEIPANDLIFSKVACLKLATLLKSTPLQEYFARILSTGAEYGF